MRLDPFTEGLERIEVVHVDFDPVLGDRLDENGKAVAQANLI